MSRPFILEQLRASAERNPGAPAFLFENQPVSYRAFMALVSVAARLFLERGIRPGEAVGVSMGQGPLTIVALLALAHVGAVSVSLVPGHPAARVALCQRHGIRRMVVTDASGAVEGVEAIVLGDLSARGKETLDGVGDFTPGEDSPFRIALTSGTTGIPKGVMQTHGGLALRLSHSLWMTDAASRVIPPNLAFTASLMLSFSALRDGGTVVFPAGGYDFPNLLAAIALHRVTHVALAPANLAAILPLVSGEKALPSVTHLRIMGGTPSAGLLESVRRKLSPHVWLPYAMNEIGIISMATPDTLARAPRSSGPIVPGARVEVLDEAGRVVPPGTVGELRLQVDGMPQDYHGHDAQAERRFRDGWFHPGDRGCVTADGLVFIEGRSDDIVNVGGHKVAPTYVEAILEEHPLVQECAVYAVTQADGEIRLEAAVVGRGALDAQGLATHARRRLGVFIAPARYHVVRSLPRNASGKIRRAELAAWVAANGA